MVIAVFGCRVGTPTGTATSGTIEEIERLRLKGKHVAVYFSKAPIPRDHDPKQLRQLEEYKESLMPDTLFWTFETTEQLYRLVSQHLAKSVSRIYQDLVASKTIGILASQLPGVIGTLEMASRTQVDKESQEESFKL